MQKLLNQEQVAAFYHSIFVDGQVAHFKEFVQRNLLSHKDVVVDVGGGCGYFAQAIQQQLGVPVRVIDMDPVSVQQCVSAGIEAFCEDALNVRRRGDEGVVCFNLILHHLVGTSDKRTALLQKQALCVWKGGKVKLFVNEYIYDSWFGNFSGWLIYQVTVNKVLSALAKAVSVVIPSLRANTFGVGVRFRSRDEWRKFFHESGFVIKGEVKGGEEVISLPRRLLLIKSIRKDSFLLESA